MKKLLMMLGALSIGSVAATTVVGCSAIKPFALQWDLNAYNNKPTDKENKIWINFSEYFDLNEAERTLYLQKSLWTGMFDADDSTAMERFNNQKLIIVKIDQLKAEVKTMILEQLDTKLVKNIELNLKHFVNSKTKDVEHEGQFLDYTLLESEATIKSIKIIKL